MTTLRTPGETARSRTLHFLAHRELWPHWPFLPVVRRRPDHDEELGVVFDARSVCGLTGYSAAVSLCNVFDLPPAVDEFLALPRETFDSAGELASAGWRVD